MGVHVFPILNPPAHLPLHPIPQGHPSAPALSTLSHVSNLDWRSVSHMIIYMPQCYSLKSPHPHLLPMTPKVCSLHLCLFCCLAYGVNITIFLISIYSHFTSVWDKYNCMVVWAFFGIASLAFHWMMEYYSAIKKNAFESILMRWVKLEPFVQSEVSQEENHQYSILI